MKAIFTYIIILFGWCGLAQTITSAEYFFNEDPGVGNGTALVVNSNSGELTQNFSISTSGLSEGFHSFYIRTLNDFEDGVWGLYSRELLYIKSFNFVGSEVTEAEYFIDSDPGIGNGTSIEFDDPSLSIQSFVYSTSGSGLSQGVHVFYVRVRNANGVWSLYDSALFTIDGVMGIADNLFNTVTVYPNPFINNINMNSSENITVEKVTVYDLNGRTVYQSNKNETSLNLEFLASGVYILKLQANNEIGSFKIVKQ